MASDYVAIRLDNERRYGTDIGRIGPMLLANRYDVRTHFIFELLQNAEDALARRRGWLGSRLANFNLSAAELRVAHSGQPFDERDVRGICGIAESTKDLTAIGRFGIGFKSVYAFTDRPEVHSGDESFAIECFVWPIGVERAGRQPNETVFVLPLRSTDATAREEIAEGLQRLGPRILLFLRQIEEIAWTVDGGPSGLYLRGQPEHLGENVRRVTLLGEENGKPDVEETWLLFSRAATTPEGADVGFVEIAFSVARHNESTEWAVEPISDAPLVVFFPTVLPTHLGFLVQGPYRTTPSRDNVPRNDPWNQHLVRETAALTVEALRWLRDHDMLDTAVLRCLPIDRAKFGEGSMLATLFTSIREALVSEPLLPRFGVGHVSAKNARLSRTQDLRELVSPSQLASLFGQGGELAWLSSDITQDRTPGLRQYLVHELGIAEVTPEMILPRLKKAFLEAQPDEWIIRLYEFLSGQPALRSRVDELPLIRLEDGTHTTARANGQSLAFLPSAIETSFPTVRRAVCATDSIRKFLESLGLTEPDPVDDVVWNVLPKYRGAEVDVEDAEYEADIRRILTAFATDSKGQREKLLAALRETHFVMAVDTCDGSKWVSKPGEVYLATERLKELFAGVPEVLLVDDAYSCLRGEDVRELLEACGATRYLQPIRLEPDFTWEQLRDLRTAAGCESISSAEPIEDHTLRGLGSLLKQMPTLDTTTRDKKAALLWDALGDLEDRRGTGVFSGSYRWYYYHRRSATFDAGFVRELNQNAWAPDGNGNLERPEFIVFDTLGWKVDPFLLSKIRFKPPILEVLAKEAGIEPGLLDLLKKLGVTSEAELRARLGVEDQREPPSATEPDCVGQPASGPDAGPTSPASYSSDSEPSGSGGGTSGSGEGARGTRMAGGGTGDQTQGDGTGRRTPGSTDGRPFISYIGAHPDNDGRDPDGLSDDSRRELEEAAIQAILSIEPTLQRTPGQNPGFDLFETDADGDTTRWIEVKAMTRDLHSHPVGLSHAQFACAAARGEAYWLYVVEHALNPDLTRILRIHDPAGRARTFTFDHGWQAVAEVVGTDELRRSQRGDTGTQPQC